MTEQFKTRTLTLDEIVKEQRTDKCIHIHTRIIYDKPPLYDDEILDFCDINDMKLCVLMGGNECDFYEEEE